MTTPPAEIDEYSGLPAVDPMPWQTHGLAVIEALRDPATFHRIAALLASDDPIDRKAGCMLAGIGYVTAAEMGATEGLRFAAAVVASAQPGGSDGCTVAGVS